MLNSWQILKPTATMKTTHLDTLFKLSRAPLFVLTMGAASLSSLSANLITIDFEEFVDGSNNTQQLSRGEQLTDQYSDQFGLNFSATTGSNPAEVWIFDTFNPTLGGNLDSPGNGIAENDGDFDLRTPGFDVANNPSDGTTSFGPGNTTGLGNVIVVQENTSPGAIPDDVVGSSVFLNWDTPITLENILIMDIEGPENASRVVARDSNGVTLFDQEIQKIATDSGQGLGNNSVVDIGFGELMGVSELNVIFTGSGAIGAVGFSEVNVVPEPATNALLAVLSVGALVYLRKRRKGKAAAKSQNA